MTQNVESSYDEYISKLKQAMPNVDPNFAHRIMYLERKLANDNVNEPYVSATIEYKPGVNVGQKVNGLREKYALEVENADKPNTLHVESRMKIEKLQTISLDRDILRIAGKADVGLGE